MGKVPNWYDVQGSDTTMMTIDKMLVKKIVFAKMQILENVKCLKSGAPKPKRLKMQNSYQRFYNLITLLVNESLPSVIFMI